MLPGVGQSCCVYNSTGSSNFNLIVLLTVALMDVNFIRSLWNFLA